ncbi:MAG TPA: extracellular solute-binding protein [Candidatus Acidoferrales bacterium]|nr:extracellular solute-binding protein [Candidatus Acidoferrales bacterium]
MSAAASVSAAPSAESTVVWYSALDRQTLNTVVQKFNAIHPGLTLEALQSGSALIPPRVMTEQTAGKYNVDVVSCDQFGLSQLADAGLFQRYKPRDADKFIKGAIDPKGYWVSLLNSTTVIAWNPQRLKLDRLSPPKSLDDLAKPEWKGKLGIDGVAYNWYQGLLATRKDAPALLKRLADNKPLITSAHNITIAQLINGEFDATPTAYGYLAERARRAGKPIDFLTPSPVIVGLEPVAIAKNAPHPIAARILVDWLLSKEMQQFFADDERTSARSDVTNDARIFNLKMPFYILPAPDRTEYNAWVSAYKALLGIAG